MTNEEAIKILNTVLLFGECECPKEEIEECLKTAIKALEQEQKDAEISVGDEVMVNDIDRKAIVIGISTFEDWDAPYNILFENGNTDWVRKDIISKTISEFKYVLSKISLKYNVYMM